jgi:hypothetical protein
MPLPCAAELWWIERTSAIRSIRRASRGIVSVRRMPGTEVAIGLNSPRTSAGESGLGSQVSMWLTPPQQYSTMHDLARPKPSPPGRVAASLRSARNSGNDSPSTLAPHPASICRRFSVANSLQLVSATGLSGSRRGAMPQTESTSIVLRGNYRGNRLISPRF